jgi:hypothetical protein
MNYRLVFRRRATRSPAAIWIGADDRNAITRASHRLEQRLQSDPLNEGESRSGRRRVAFYDPLAVFFTVDSATRRVTITDIKSR